MPDSKPKPAATGVRAIDQNLVRAALRRMARNPQPPWLHAEVAGRMAERLPVVRLEPSTVLDWWGYTGASAALLRAAYPKARRVVFEPDEALLARSRDASQRPWWTARRGAAVEVRGEEPQPGAAQLLWANMMLHAVADLPGMPLGEAPSDRPASQVVAEYYRRYEEHFDLQVLRPAKVLSVNSTGLTAPALGGERRGGAALGHGAGARLDVDPGLAAQPRTLRRAPGAH